MFRLATAVIFRLDTAFIVRLATAIIFRLDTAIIFRLDTAIIFRLAIIHQFCNKYALFILDAFFAEKKPPEGTAPASTGGLEAFNHLVWRHPITLRSLVVKHTAWTRH